MVVNAQMYANIGYEFTSRCVPAALKSETARRMSVEQFERCCEYAIATSNHVSWLETNVLSFANQVHHVHILQGTFIHSVNTLYNI